MLDLLVAADLVREQTAKALAMKVPRRESRPHARTGLRTVRSGLAAGLRRLAELLEPSPHDVVPRHCGI
jgi:hypothetical protein